MSTTKRTKLTKKEALQELEDLLNNYGESVNDYPYLDVFKLSDHEDASNALEADLHYLGEEYGY